MPSDGNGALQLRCLCQQHLVQELFAGGGLKVVFQHPQDLFLRRFFLFQVHQKIGLDQNLMVNVMASWYVWWWPMSQQTLSIKASS
mgnify:CR=1 FL=1